MKTIAKCLLSFTVVILALFGVMVEKAYADGPPKDMEVAVQQELPLIRDVMTTLKGKAAEKAVPGEPIRQYFLPRDEILKYTPSTKLSEMLQEMPRQEERGAWQVPMLIDGEVRGIVTMIYRSERGWVVDTITGAKKSSALPRLLSSLPEQLEARGISGDYSIKWVVTGPSYHILVACESGEEFLAPLQNRKWWAQEFEMGKLYDPPIVMKEVVTDARSGECLPGQECGGGASAGNEDVGFWGKYRWLLGICLGSVALGFAIYHLWIKPRQESL